MTEADITTTGTIEDTESKDGVAKTGRAYTNYRVRIRDHSGSYWYSTFDDPGVSRGDHVELVYTTRPNPNSPEFPYRNIQSIVPRNGTQDRYAEDPADDSGFDHLPSAVAAMDRDEAKAVVVNNYRAPGDPRQDSIERQVALKCAVELLGKAIATPSDVVEYAEEFYRWLARVPGEAAEPAVDERKSGQQSQGADVADWSAFYDVLKSQHRGNADVAQITGSMAPQAYIESKNLTIAEFLDECFEVWDRAR